jgi:hypothetical protein
MEMKIYESLRRWRIGGMMQRMGRREEGGGRRGIPPLPTNTQNERQKPTNPN